MFWAGSAVIMLPILLGLYLTAGDSRRTMTTTLASTTLTLSSRCSCSFCPHCQLSFTRGDSCQQCARTTLPLADCQGCHIEALEDFEAALLRPWLEHNPSATGYYIAELDWRGRAGVFHGALPYCPDTHEPLPEHIAPSIGTWQQHWTSEAWPGGQLTCIQTGRAGLDTVQLRPATEKEVDQL